MRNRSDSGKKKSAAARPRRPQSAAFLTACGAVVGRSAVATAVTSGKKNVLRYANPSFFELVGRIQGSGVGEPVAAEFPALVQAESRALLDRVHETGEAGSADAPIRYAHPQRGVLFLALSAWRCGAPRARMIVLQFVETRRARVGRRQDDFSRDLRDVNERLVVAGLREHELVEEETRRRREAEQAAERSQNALQSNVVQTQDLARRLITAQEAERTRLARELHDDVSQQLAALSIALSALRRVLADNPDVARTDVDQLQQRTTALIETIRLISHDLHPGSLRAAGLLPALRHLCADFDRPDAIVLRRDGDLSTVPDDIALVIYRIAQEALRNVMRHAAANHVDVVLSHDNYGIHLEITDDGRGFERQDVQDGLGLMSMAERVLVVNGELFVDSIPGTGTRIRVRIPEESLQPRQHTPVAPGRSSSAHDHAAQ